MNLTLVALELIELLVNLSVFEPDLKVTAGAGEVNGFLINKQPFKSPTTSVVNDCPETVACAELDSPTKIIFWDAYP